MTVRYSIDLPASLKIGETTLSARIRNLSLGGVYIVGPTLTIGTRCRISFVDPSRADTSAIDRPRVPFSSDCIARWTTAEGCGLMFDSVQPIGTHQLARCIREASRPTLAPGLDARPRAR